MTTEVLNRSNTLVYTLSDFSTIQSRGVNYKLDEQTINLINSIEKEVESRVGYSKPTTTNSVHKREVKPSGSASNHQQQQQQQQQQFGGFTLQKKKGKNAANAAATVADEETFKTIKIIHKSEDGQIDLIRSEFNKISEKGYIDCRAKIMSTLDSISTENRDEFARITDLLFEIASNNRYCSKLYCDMFSELITTYASMRNAFDFNVVAAKFLLLFENIEDVDPSVDYQKFIDMNTNSEKRKSSSSFFINLMTNNIVSKGQIFQLLFTLVSKVVTNISSEGKVKEIDELTENIVILLQKDLFALAKDNKDTAHLIRNPLSNTDVVPIMNVVKMLSQCKPRQYPSLTNKSIFKFMDVMDKDKPAPKK